MAAQGDAAGGGLAVIFDIDGTLLDSVTVDKWANEKKIFARPHIVELLDWCFANCAAVALWTRADRHWAEARANAAALKDPRTGKRRPWAFVWHRDRGTLSTDGKFRKKLQKVWKARKLRALGFVPSRTLIVEDTPSNCAKSYGNAVYVPTFIGGGRRQATAETAEATSPMLALRSFLAQLQATAVDVRTVEKRGWYDRRQCLSAPAPAALASAGAVAGHGDLVIREVHASDVRCYKVIPVAAASLRKYNGDAAVALKKANETKKDWQALYTQFRRDHALGTLPYRWDAGHAQATLVEATFESLDIVVIDGPMMWDGSVCGRAKAELIKERLGVDGGAALMAALGMQSKVALVRETATEWELIIPHALLPRLKMSERAVAHFEKRATVPITRRWRLAGKEVVWSQGEPLPSNTSSSSSIPDLGMPWLLVPPPPPPPPPPDVVAS